MNTMSKFNPLFFYMASNGTYFFFYVSAFLVSIIIITLLVSRISDLLAKCACEANEKIKLKNGTKLIFYAHFAR